MSSAGLKRPSCCAQVSVQGAVRAQSQSALDWAALWISPGQADSTLAAFGKAKCCFHSPMRHPLLQDAFETQPSRCAQKMLRGEGCSAEMPIADAMSG